MPLLLKVYSLEDKLFEVLFDDLTAEQLGKKPGDITIVDGQPHVTIEVEKEKIDDRFDGWVDVVTVKRRASQ